jgi:hypothetical protein
MEPRRVVPAACAPSDSGGVTLAAAMYTTTSHCRRLMIEVFVPDRVSVFRQAAANYLSVTYASLHHTSSSYYADERQKEEKRKYCIEAMSLIEMKVVHVTGKLQIIVLFWKGYSLSLTCKLSDIMKAQVKRQYRTCANSWLYCSIRAAST